ncbi:hypothetical protein OIU74_020452 [Salix koriyanagi]|uniref:Uncharacterized protein n=1 Tax=Salix koriyanagi TaxID=2511006 RepID=A0A9Q0P664_9ROSI|nr:hypothetical protein OIU74_020452 [Salix koriyanagi]
MPHLTGSGHYVFQASESSKDLGSTTKSFYIYPPGTEALSMVSSLRLPLDLLIISPKLKALNDKGAIPALKCKKYAKPNEGKHPSEILSTETFFSDKSISGK